MRRLLSFASCVALASALVGASAGPAMAVDYWIQDIYNASYNPTPQKTNCWCVTAVVRAALQYVPNSDVFTQSTIDAYIKGKNLLDWTDDSILGYKQCHKGVVDPSYANDSRGAAWGLYHYTPAGYGYRDYISATNSNSSRDSWNWEIILNIRATGDPVPVTVLGGAHEMLVVGYATDIDPGQLAYSAGNTMRWMYVWDPWFQAGFSGLNPYSPNELVTIADWNANLFKPDLLEGDANDALRTPPGAVGSPYYNKYVVVLRAWSSASNPDNNTSASYGAVWYYNQTGLSVSDASNSQFDGFAFYDSIGTAVETGLRQNRIIGMSEFPGLTKEYELGGILAVESRESGVMSYSLVELVVGGRVVAVALVNEVGGEFAFGALRKVEAGGRLPNQADLAAQIAAEGLHGPARLVWGQTLEGTPRFMPFVIGLDASERPALAGPRPGTPRFELQ